jgi:hypothetical protein
LPPFNQILKKSWPDEIERLHIENLYSPFVPNAAVPKLLAKWLLTYKYRTVIREPEGLWSLFTHPLQKQGLCAL